MNGVDASRSVAAGDSDLDGTLGRGDERRGEEVMSATEAGLRSVLAFCAHTLYRVGAPSEITKEVHFTFVIVLFSEIESLSWVF